MSYEYISNRPVCQLFPSVPHLRQVHHNPVLLFPQAQCLLNGLAE